MNIKEKIIKTINSLIDGNNSNAAKLLNELHTELIEKGDEKLAIKFNALKKKMNSLSKSSNNTNSTDNFIIPLLLQKYLTVNLSNGSKYRKIIIYGPPGMGKTKIIEWLSFKLNKELVKLKLPHVMGSHLGETIKNLYKFISESNNNSIIFIDEIDSIITNRFENDDLGEIKRATISMLDLLDNLDESKHFFCATNKIENLDPAFLRRMDDIINIEDYYQESDFEEIAENYYVDFNNEFREIITKLHISHKDSPSDIERFSRQLNNIRSENDLFIKKILLEFNFSSNSEMFWTLKNKFNVKFSDQSKAFDIDHQKIGRSAKNYKEVE